jgi:hypothetical protein
MEKNGNKILWQVKTSWTLMLKPAKQVLSQYSILLYKMHLDSSVVKVAAANQECLLNVETLVGLAWLLPLLEQLN